MHHLLSRLPISLPLWLEPEAHVRTVIVVPLQLSSFLLSLLLQTFRRLGLGLDVGFVLGLGLGVGFGLDLGLGIGFGLGLGLGVGFR